MSKLNEEYVENSDRGADRSFNPLSIQYETCRQENHNLQRKIKLNEVMLQEVKEAYESRERSLEKCISQKDKLISEAQEKNRNLTEEYENKIANLEKLLTQRAQEIVQMNQQVKTLGSKAECTPDVEPTMNLSFVTENVALKNHIDQLLLELALEKDKSERAEGLIDNLKIQCDQAEDHYRNIKEQFEEKHQKLKEAQGDLALMRAQILETDSIDKPRKGFSVFTELEDRRQKATEKLNKLRNKYVELKHVCKSQIARNNMLQAERIQMLKQLDNDSDLTLLDNKKSIEEYKKRISHLEDKLKSEINKNKEPRPTDLSFGYFETLVNAKQKEIDKLRIKIEDLTTKLLIQEEVERNIIKEQCRWKDEAEALKTQMTTITDIELKFNLSDDDDMKEFEDISREIINDTILDDSQLVSKQLLEKSMRPSLNDSIEPDQCTTMEFNRAIHIGSNKEKQEENATNKNKFSKKLVSFVDDTSIISKKDPEKPTSCKYPIVHVPY